MGRHVAAFGGVAVALLEQHAAVRPDQNRAERMVAPGPRARGYREGLPQMEMIVRHGVRWSG
jgi:hypothetical protein